MVWTPTKHAWAATKRDVSSASSTQRHTRARVKRPLVDPAAAWSTGDTEHASHEVQYNRHEGVSDLHHKLWENLSLPYRWEPRPKGGSRMSCKSCFAARLRAEALYILLSGHSAIEELNDAAVTKTRYITCRRGWGYLLSVVMSDSEV